MGEIGKRERGLAEQRRHDAHEPIYPPCRPIHCAQHGGPQKYRTSAPFTRMWVAVTQPGGASVRFISALTLQLSHE
jgi:hypothetical protein